VHRTRPPASTPVLHCSALGPTGQSAAAPAATPPRRLVHQLQLTTILPSPPGVAFSKDGVNWSRGVAELAGDRGAGGERARRAAAPARLRCACWEGSAKHAPIRPAAAPAGTVDVGIVLEANPDWWTMDTCHMAVSDVQAGAALCCQPGRRSCRATAAVLAPPTTRPLPAAAAPAQVLSNSSVSSGVGVYWMFYSGGDFEPVPAPEGLPGMAAGQAYEGVRMRAGLAMSQVGRWRDGWRGAWHAGPARMPAAAWAQRGP
jgi:hypothetical protein